MNSLQIAPFEADKPAGCLYATSVGRLSSFDFMACGSGDERIFSSFVDPTSGRRVAVDDDSASIIEWSNF